MVFAVTGNTGVTGFAATFTATPVAATAGAAEAEAGIDVDAVAEGAADGVPSTATDAEGTGAGGIEATAGATDAEVATAGLFFVRTVLMPNPTPPSTTRPPTTTSAMIGPLLFGGTGNCPTPEFDVCHALFVDMCGCGVVAPNGVTCGIGPD